MDKSINMDETENFILNGTLIEDGASYEINLDDKCNCTAHCYNFECPDNLADKSGSVNGYIWQPKIVTIGENTDTSCLLFSTVENGGLSDSFNKFSPLATLGLPESNESIDLSECGWTISLWSIIINIGDLPELLQAVQVRWVIFMKGTYDKVMMSKYDELDIGLMADFSGVSIAWNIFIHIGDKEFIFKLDNFDPLIMHSYMLVYSDRLNVFVDGVIVTVEENFVSGTTNFAGYQMTTYVEKHGTISLGWQSPEQVGFYQLDGSVYRPWDGCMDDICIFDKPLDGPSIQSLYNNNSIILFRDTYCWTVPTIYNSVCVSTITITLCVRICTDICDLNSCETIRIYSKKNGEEKTLLEICDINKSPGELFIEPLNDEFHSLIKLCIEFSSLYCEPLKLVSGDKLCVSIVNGCYVVDTYPTIITGSVV